MIFGLIPTLLVVIPVFFWLKAKSVRSFAAHVMSAALGGFVVFGLVLYVPYMTSNLVSLSSGGEVLVKDGRITLQGIISLSFGAAWGGNRSRLYRGGLVVLARKWQRCLTIAFIRPPPLRGGYRLMLGVRDMGYSVLSILVLFFVTTVLANDEGFNSDPDVYRGAFYGHLISGGIVVEGMKLNSSEVLVHSVSYVHLLKDQKWYRSVKVSSQVLCKIKSSENPNFHVVEIDTHLSIDGLKVIKVFPLLTSKSDKRLPANNCVGI